MTDAPDDSAPPAAKAAAGAPLSDAELREVAARVRTSGDPLLRRLLTSYVTLRSVTADVVAFVAAREGGAAVAGTPLLLRARSLTDVAGR